MIKYLSIITTNQIVLYIILIYNLSLVNEIFENILVGSSLNPDIQDTNSNIAYFGFDQSDHNADQDIEYDEENYEEYEAMEEYKEDNDLMNDIDEYEPYKFENTVDKIFKTEKTPKNPSEYDPRRYEDAE